MTEEAAARQDGAPLTLADFDPYTPTVAAIYAAYESKADSWESRTVSLSALGTECDRSIWYSFRWASLPEKFGGQKLRLFATGHREEARLVQDLRNAGVKIEAVDPATGRQWTVTALGGHLKGKLDGKAIGVPEAPKTVHVLEAKTHNGKSFHDLLRKGVKLSKPGHYRQAMGYMHLEGISRALYIAHNKDTDELYSERINYDLIEASQLMARAERIINADNSPAKLHADPTSKMAFECRWCSHRHVCHQDAFPRVNCRTCLSSTPVDGGWHCDFHDKMLSIDEQKLGCSGHLFITGLVPGEQIDCDEEVRTVTYTMADGSTWIDGKSA